MKRAKMDLAVDRKGKLSLKKAEPQFGLKFTDLENKPREKILREVEVAILTKMNDERKNNGMPPLPSIYPVGIKLVCGCSKGYKYELPLTDEKCKHGNYFVKWYVGKNGGKKRISGAGS